MPGAKTLSDVREQEYTRSVGTAITGVAIVLVCLLALYFLGLYLNGSSLLMARVGLVIGILVGLTLVGISISKVIGVNRIPKVAFACPYCNGINQLLATPTDDFECEVCHATVRFENGLMVPVIAVTCGQCGKENRMSSKAQRGVCEQCDATLELGQMSGGVAFASGGQAPLPQAGTPINPASVNLPGARPAPAPRPTMLLTTNQYNVLLTATEGAREGQMAELIQENLGVDIKEARRLLDTIGDKSPLIIGMELSQDDAEALRVQFQQLGAKVTLRSSH